QALALAHGVVDDALVLAVDLSPSAHKVPGWEVPSRPPADEGGVVPVGHKADVLAVPLSGVDKAVLLRQAACLLLGEPTQRQQQPGELPLGEGVEHIALVLVLIQALFQKPPAGGS